MRVFFVYRYEQYLNYKKLMISIGLVGYGSMGDESSFQKPYSDETNWEIDEEVRNVVKEQYQLTKDLLTKHKELISQ